MDYSDIGDSSFKVYPARFRVVGLFILVQMMTSILMNTLTPIAALLTVVYDHGPVVINLGGLLYALMHPLFTFPAAYVIDTYGSKTGIIVGSILGIVGISLRMLVNYSFYWVIAGQVIAGIGRPFILNCQVKLSASWFTAETRGKVTQILTLIINVSLIIGMLIPGFVFKGYKPEAQTIDDGKQLTFQLMVIEAVIGYLCFFPNILLQRNKPPTPPSDSADFKRDPFNVAIPRMMKNRNYLYLLLSFGCFFGIFNGISLTLSFLLEPWFKDQNLSLAVSAVGGSPIISGIIGVAIIGPMQRRSKTYKKWILICMGGSTLAMSLFYPILETNSLILACLVSMFNSFFLIPLVPIILQLGCQLIFPVGQGSAVGMLFACGNLAGFIFGLILNQIAKGQSKGESAAGFGFCFGMFLIGILVACIMKQEKNRELAESQASELRRSNSGKQEQEPKDFDYAPPALDVDDYKL